ncbi:MAG: hypothetical protein ACREOK_11365 [Gemmatimonadaceae bacterium]
MITVEELASLLSHTGLPPHTAVGVRLIEAGTEHTAGLSLSRVQVVRQLRAGANQPPEFALELVIAKTPLPRL